MKKTLILLLAMMFAFAFSATAQDEGGKFGIKAGVNLANMTGDIDGNEMLVGFAFGGFYAHPLSESITLQPELLFSMKGTKSDSGDEELNVNYLEIPVLFKYGLETESSFAPFFFAGPAIGILMSAEEDGEDIKEYLKSTDISIAFGAGFNYEALSFDIRYTMGITDIPDEGDGDLKNTNISLMVGYGF